MAIHGADQAFRGVGAIPGLLVWGIDSSRLVPVPKSSYGRFFSGTSYIVLNTVLRKRGPPQHDIHYWVGKDSNEADAALASNKVIELDAALGSCSVQYREMQGCETEKFLSYFKPCIIPSEGIFSPEGPHKNNYQACLLRCKGEHAVSVVEVPFARSSLNHNDVFILDTEGKIYLFCGSKSSIQERAKALEVVQYVKDNRHGGRCEISYIEDGKFVADPDVGEFWGLFGGYAPLGRNSPSTDEMGSKKIRKLYWINKGKICPLETTNLEKSNLNSNWCYMLDCGENIFVWMGRKALVTERKMSISATEDLIRSHNRSVSTQMVILTEGSETAQFKLRFDSWPQTAVSSLYEDGREKVAAIFKFQGYDVKELPEDNYHPYIDCTGTLKVWLVDCSHVSLVSASEQGKLYSGNCYVVQYIYPFCERDDHLFFAWLGRSSIMEDRVAAISHMFAFVESTKGHPVMAQIVEGKEPIQFYAIFHKLVILKGGTSPGFKRSFPDRGGADETNDEGMAALFRLQGSGSNDMQAIQVDPVSSSLNSSYCYVLQDKASMYAWAGNLSTACDRDILHRMPDFINPLKQPISVREGNEPDIFWSTISGKMEYPKEKEAKCHNDDPHLFSCLFKEGDIKAKEIYSFSQDDLNTEDVLVLDCYYEIYVWVGQHAGVTSNQEALSIGKKFIEADILLEGLSVETAIYIVTEGFEPSFFTCFFEWDYSKAYIEGNSFERKLALLKGLASHIETFRSQSKKSVQLLTDHSPNNGRRAYKSERPRMRSVSPASSGVIDAKVPKSSRSFSPTLKPRELLTTPTYVNNELSVNSSNKESVLAEGLDCILTEFETETKTDTVAKVDEEKDNEIQDGSRAIPYEQLKVTSGVTIPGIDTTKREAYISSEEFREKFGMAREVFYTLPLWRRNKLKVALNLF